jgi:DNA-binding response OmpR family regulator
MPKKRILLVEDSPAIRAHATKLLTDAGYEVSTAVDWVTANEQYYAAGRRPDLLLIDVNLGATVNGTKIAWAYATARQRVGGAPRPVLLLFSDMDEAVLTRLASESGADGFIRKVDGLGELVERVDWWLSSAFVESLQTPALAQRG